jgi:TfoX/Sxy family transcriptional regulator of competence genes
MAVTEGFKEFVRDLFAEFGPVTIRNMFGGAGVYADGVMFAILVDDTLYLKTNAVSAFAYASEGMTPFKYTPRGKEPVVMSFGRRRRVCWRNRTNSPAGHARRTGSRMPARRNRRESVANRSQNRPSARRMMAATPEPSLPKATC